MASQASQRTDAGRKQGSKPNRSKPASVETRTADDGLINTSIRKKPKEYITGDPVAPLLKVHNGHIIRHAQSWLTAHPHAAFDDEPSGVAANTTEIKVLAPPVDHTSNSRTCPINRAKFTAVRTVYVMASEASQAYRLLGLDPQSLKFQEGSSGTQLLQHMWEQAAASDEALQGFQWLPGAPPVVQLQPRHAAADRVQRATERDVLTGLSKTFERAFCMRLGPTALAESVGVDAAHMCIVATGKHRNRIREARALTPDAVVALAATAACRLLLLLFKRHPGRGFMFWPQDHVQRCQQGLLELHGCPRQRRRAAYMMGFADPEATRHKPTEAEQAAVTTPPLPFEGCRNKMYKHMTVMSYGQAARPPASGLHTNGAVLPAGAPGLSAGASVPAGEDSAAASAPVRPGVPSGCAPLALSGDCIRGYGPQDRERWKRPFPEPELLLSMSGAQHMELQRLGWQAVVRTGKELPQSAKWNATRRSPGAAAKRRKKSRTHKTLLAASSLLKPLAKLPVSRPAFLKPMEFVGSYNAKMRRWCPQAARMHRQQARLPPRCTDPAFVWPATMRPILTEVLITPCADKFRRPRQLSAASKALLKYAADEERQLRDFLSAGGCKGLHTPHVCPYGSRRITLPRFFTLLNTARRNWATTGLLNVAMPHVGRLTRPEQRFLKRGFPLIATEAAVFAGAKEAGLVDGRLERLCAHARAALDMTPTSAAVDAADAGHSVPGGVVTDADEDALMERIRTFLWSKSLFPWAQEQSYGGRVEWEHDPVIRGSTCVITAPVLGYLSSKLEGERKAAVREAATDLLLMQKLLVLVSDEGRCLDIMPSNAGRPADEDTGAAPASTAPGGSDVEMGDNMAHNRGGHQASRATGSAEATPRISCTRHETLEFAHGAIALLMAGPLGVLLEALIVGVVLDSGQAGAGMPMSPSQISETRAVMCPYSVDEDMAGDEAPVREQVNLEIARARVSVGVAAFQAYMRDALRGGGLGDVAQQAALCARLHAVRTLAMHLPLLPSLQEHLWRLLDGDGTLTGDLRHCGVPVVSYSPPLFRGWRGLGMEEWRAIVVLRRAEVLELEGLLPAVAKDWDVEVMSNERGGAAGLQHLAALSLPRVRAFWGLGGLPKVARTAGSVQERYVPLWWTPAPDEFEYADRLPAGPAIKDVDTLFKVGAIDLNMRQALRCTQQRRVTYGTHGRSRPPAWSRKDLTGINGRATIKHLKTVNPMHKLLKRSFASAIDAAAREMFSRGGRLELNREFWRFRSPERGAIYRVWVDHLRATGRNPPVPPTRQGFPHGVAPRLADAASRRPLDSAIPRDVFTWIFEEFDDATDGFALPEAPQRPLPERESLPFVLAEHSLLEVEGRSDEIDQSRLQDVQRPHARDDVVGQLDWLRELLRPHGALLACSAQAEAAGAVNPTAVLETNLPPYTYPVQPLSLFATARETSALPCQSDWHASVHMRLSWPPGFGVALPLGWRALGLLQVAALERGFITRRTVDALTAAVAAGEAQAKAADALPPWGGLGRTAPDSGLAAGVVRVSGLRLRQSVLHGTRFAARASLEAQGWLFKGCKIARYPAQPEAFFLPKTSRTGFGPKKRTAAAKDKDKGASAKRRGRDRRPQSPRVRPRPPRACGWRSAFDLAGVSEATPAAVAVAAQNAAAAAATAAAQTLPLGTGGGRSDAVLAQARWRATCEAERHSAAQRRKAAHTDIATARAQGLFGTDKAPPRAEEVMAALPFLSGERVTAAVEHRASFGDVLSAARTAAEDPSLPRRRADAVPFEPIANPDVGADPGAGGGYARWQEQLRADRLALVRQVDTVAADLAYQDSQLPAPVMAALQAALASAQDPVRLVTFAPLPAALSTRTASKPALVSGGRPAAASARDRTAAAQRADRRVTFVLPQHEQDRPQEHAGRSMLRVARRGGTSGSGRAPAAAASGTLACATRHDAGGGDRHGAGAVSGLVATPDGNTTASTAAAPRRSIRTPAGDAGAAGADGADRKRSKSVHGVAVASGTWGSGHRATAAGADGRGSSPPVAAQSPWEGAEAESAGGGPPGSAGCTMHVHDGNAMESSPEPPPIPALASPEPGGGVRPEAAAAAGSGGPARHAVQRGAEARAGEAGAGGVGAAAAAEGDAGPRAAADDEANVFMTDIERERAKRQAANRSRLAELQSDMAALFADEVGAAKTAKQNKPRKALGSLSGKGVNAAPPVQRPRRDVPKPDYSLAKADADYRASIAEARRSTSAAAAARRAARRAAGGGSAAAGSSGRRRTAAETAAAGPGDCDGTVRHCVTYNTTPVTSIESWIAAGEAADKHLASLGEGAIACTVNLTLSMIDSGFWLQLPKELVHAVLDALSCDSFNPSSDTDTSSGLHVFQEKGAGKTAMQITVRGGRLEKPFHSAARRSGATLPEDGAAESVLQFLPKGASRAAGVRSAGLSGGWRGVSIAHKLQRGDCAVFQVHLGGEVDAAVRGSAAHIASARAALQGATMSAWFFRARSHDDGLVDPYAEPPKLDEADTAVGMEGSASDGDVDEESDSEEDDDGVMDLG